MWFVEFSVASDFEIQVERSLFLSLKKKRGGGAELLFAYEGFVHVFMA